MPEGQQKDRGSCAGYSIVSDLTFATLRDGPGTPLYVNERPDLGPVGEMLAEWRPRPGNPFHGKLFGDDRYHAFWTSDAGWFGVNAAVPSIWVSPTTDPLRRELRLFGIPTSLCAFEAGDITVHAAAVEVDGQGILFAGPSRYGKTTLAAAFARAGHRLLSEDSTRCRNGESPAVYPGPAALRLRDDVAASMTIPGTSIGAAYDDRVSLIVDKRHRGPGSPVPLRMIVIPRDSASHGDMVLQSVPKVRALRDLYALTFRPPRSDSRAAVFERVTDLVRRVDTIELHRPMTFGSLGAVVSLLEREIAR